jgi:hypothetical protein
MDTYNNDLIASLTEILNRIGDITTWAVPYEGVYRYNAGFTSYEIIISYHVEGQTIEEASGIAYHTCVRTRADGKRVFSRDPIKHGAVPLLLEEVKYCIAARLIREIEKGNARALEEN